MTTTHHDTTGAHTGRICRSCHRPACHFLTVDPPGVPRTVGECLSCWADRIDRERKAIDPRHFSWPIASGILTPAALRAGSSS